VASADFLIHNADLVLTCAGPAPRRGLDQNNAGPIAGGAVAARDGRIVFVGTTEACARSIPVAADAFVIDAAGRTVVPGFVDAHTHAVFAGDRRDELRRRLAGESYASIAAAGGGILATVQATRDASELSLVDESRPRLAEMLRNGTTTAEVKSGYGLETRTELKILRAIATLDRTQPIDLVPTFLGAHEVPPEHARNRRRYIDCLVDEMIPQAAGLARWCDVFCEQGFFTPAESLVILRAGIDAGLQPRIHADELGPSGGVNVAAALHARSADHLVHTTSAGVDTLASGGVVATLLPIAAFYLKLGRYAPARDFIGRRVPVALGTDLNPGGGFSSSMASAMAIACFAMHLTFDEALVAATLNAAYSLDRHEDLGSLETGKLMDAVILNGDPIGLLRLGSSPIEMVVKRGRVVWTS
jgi:imidazolonepropionase